MSRAGSERTDASAALARLARGIQRCRRCPLHEGRTHAVPGEGAASAEVMLIGEAPGAREDELGRPFVGRAGRSLDELLASAGLERSRMFVTGAVKCRPPNNRDPRAGELATCRESWLEGQIEAVDPRLIVLMGKAAARSVLGEDGPLRDLHGVIRRRDGRACLITYHPAAAGRFPAAGEAMRRDLRAVQRFIEA